MTAVLEYIISASLGVFVAWLLTRVPELRHLRAWQMILVAGAFTGICWVMRETHGRPEMGTDIILIVIIALTAFLLAPNIAHYCGAGLSNFLDRQDWTPAEEELALRPIKELIDQDRYYQALGDLECLLVKHKPTYEAMILHAKLLHHVARWADTSEALLKAIRLSHTAQQQLVAMELLAQLEDRLTVAPQSAVPGRRQFRIMHELVLFHCAADRTVHKVIPPGEYEVESASVGKQLWLRLAGEEWGNAVACWEAAGPLMRDGLSKLKKGK
jgi:hypothetical protein